jgi:halocyanin-like protein
MTERDTTTGRTHDETEYTNHESATRRDLLKAGATATAAAAGLSGSAAASEGGGGLDGWFENVSNYDGVVDRTGESEVTLTVGATGNNGNFAFGPAAVRVDPGTNVVWKWLGKGGSHNVVAEDGSFESEIVDKKGHTFEHTFEEEGVFKYACTPHQTLGMKGAVVVGDKEVGSSGYDLGTTEYAIGGSILLGMLSPIAFAWVLFKRDPNDHGR